MIDYSKKMKFTEGEWVVSNYGPLWNNKELDNIQITFGDLEENITELIYTQADADLIAAAPELLRELIDRYQQHYCGCGHPACKSCEDDRCTETVLSKALGVIYE